MSPAPATTTHAAPVVRGTRFPEFARAHPLRAFVAVTFAFSWTFDLIAFAVLDLKFEVGVIVATFGPAVGPTP